MRKSTKPTLDIDFETNSNESTPVKDRKSSRADTIEDPPITEQHKSKLNEMKEILDHLEQYHEDFKQSRAETEQSILKAVEELFDRLHKILEGKKDAVRVNILQHIESVSKAFTPTWDLNLKNKIIKAETQNSDPLAKELIDQNAQKVYAKLEQTVKHKKELENLKDLILEQEKTFANFINSYNILLSEETLPEVRQRRTTTIRTNPSANLNTNSLVPMAWSDKKTMYNQADLNNPFEEELIFMVEDYNDATISKKKRADLLKMFEGAKIRSLIKDGDQLLTLNDFIEITQERDLAVDKINYFKLTSRKEKIDEKPIQALKGLLGPLLRLNRLSLNLYNAANLKDKDLQLFFLSLDKLKNISHFRFVITDNAYITDKVLDALQIPLANFDNLTALTLHFDRCENITDTFAERIQKPLEKLKHIRFFTLSVEGCPRLTYKLFSSLKKPMSCLKDLSEMKLNFSNCNVISDVKSALKPFKQVVGVTKDIQSIHLKFEGCEGPADKIFKRLRKPIPTFKTLRELNLNFSKCIGLTNSAFVYLEKSLPSIQTLRTIAFDFSRCPMVNDGGFETLARAISSQYLLNNLSLNFHSQRNESITDHVFEIIKKLLPFYKNLLSLTLNFERCKNITDTGFKFLKDVFNLLWHLNVINLNFAACPKITNAAFKDFAKSLGGNTKLRQLSLNFSCTSSIGDDTFKELAELPSKVAQLTQLKLEFQELTVRTKNVTDKALDYLQQILPKMKSLRILYFDFQLCANITKEGANNLLKQVQEIPNHDFRTPFFKMKMPPDFDAAEELEIKWEMTSQKE